MAVDAGAQALSIDVDALAEEGCFGNVDCELAGAVVSAATPGRVLVQKTHNGATGFGVSGGPSGGEIDIGETLRVDFEQSRSIIAIKILFLYNGPEFSDRAEKAQVTADGAVYTLSVGNDADDASAGWDGPDSATVTKCGATDANGTGCFIVTDPFPGVVSRLDFTAIPGGTPFGGPGTNDSDYSIELIEVGAEAVVDLENCAGASGCPVASVAGDPAFTLSSLEVENPGGSTEATVIPVRIPDCRYIPRVCLDLLPPTGDTPAGEDAARAKLIALGVIRTLDPSGPNKLNPAAQQLNVKKLLPPAVTSLFDASGTPPDGLPSLYIGSRWRGQEEINEFWIDGLFFKTDDTIVFQETFEGLIDVSVLTGHELGCVADLDDLLAWDLISNLSERARSVGGRHIDRIINVGCQNPTKVSGERLSLYSLNLGVNPHTYGRTIKTSKPKVTVNNDAVFARLVQSLWTDLGEVRGSYACKQADPVATGGVPPLSRSVCNRLKSLWSIANLKLNLCVNASFFPASSYRTWICGLARASVDLFEAALPATATGTDVYNRLGELKARVDAVQHVWDERFIKSQIPSGYCREWGTCPP